MSIKHQALSHDLYLGIQIPAPVAAQECQLLQRDPSPSSALEHYDNHVPVKGLDRKACWVKIVWEEKKKKNKHGDVTE